MHSLTPVLGLNPVSIGRFGGSPLGGPGASVSGAAAEQTAVLPLVTSAQTLFSATVTPGSVSAVLPLVTSAQTVFDFTVNNVIKVSDTFTRADSSTSLGSAEIGGAYTASPGTFGITGNKAYVATPTADSLNAAYQSVPYNNVTVSCDITTSPTRTAAALYLRYGGVNDWLRLAVFKAPDSFPNSIYLDQIVGGSYSLLAEVTSAGFATSTTYNVKAVISGTTVTSYIDSVERIAATTFNNAGLTTQRYAFGIFYHASYDDAASRFDNFLVTS